MPDSHIFTVGGTVQAGDGIYLPRPADTELLQLCQAGEFSYVLTARQMGKSSLMVGTAQRLNAARTRTVTIDLTGWAPIWRQSNGISVSWMNWSRGSCWM